MLQGIDTRSRGGGNIPNLDVNKFGPALRWMSYEAMEKGLHMKPYKGEWQEIIPNSSMTWFWRCLEVLPIKRLSYEGADCKTRW
jgi:hypothetical protein